MEFMKVHIPIGGVLIWCTCSGIHIIAYEPMEILVAVNTDVFHFVMVDMYTIEIPQDHNILKGTREGRFSALWDQL